MTMTAEDIRVAIFGLALIVAFWGIIVALIPFAWFRRLITGEDGSSKE